MTIHYRLEVYGDDKQDRNQIPCKQERDLWNNTTWLSQTGTLWGLDFRLWNLFYYIVDSGRETQEEEEQEEEEKEESKIFIVAQLRKGRTILL